MNLFYNCKYSCWTHRHDCYQLHICTHTYCRLDYTFMALCRVRFGQTRLFEVVIAETSFQDAICDSLYVMSLPGLHFRAQEDCEKLLRSNIWHFSMAIRNHCVYACILAGPSTGAWNAVPPVGCCSLPCCESKISIMNCGKPVPIWYRCCVCRYSDDPKGKLNENGKDEGRSLQRIPSKEDVSLWNGMNYWG